MIQDKNSKKLNQHYDDYAFFVYGLVKQLQPNSVLEVGLGPFGNTADFILKAFVENEESGGPDNHKYIVIDSEPTKEGIEVLNKYNKKYWDLRIGDSQNRNLFYQEGAMITLGLIDGNHTTQYCFNDVANLLLCNNFDAPNGLLVFHDTRMPTVNLAIKKLQTEFDLDVFYLPQNSSIALAKLKQ